MKTRILICTGILVTLSAYSQETLQTVTERANGNATTKNIWIGMPVTGGVTEQALNLGGKIKLLGSVQAYTTGTDANQPTIYRSGVNTLPYPFNNYDNLILQAGMQDRDILFVTGSTPSPRMILKAGGALGLGTSTPVANIDIVTSTDVYGLKIGDITNSNIRVAGTAGGAAGHGLVQTFRNGNTPGGVLSLQRDGGSVGIGTIAPGPYKLAVEGTLGARKIKVTQQLPWADFVFHDEYRLPAIADVEKFILQHKHLPEIPTEKDVHRDGIDLGDMNAKLLQKIEELTLYIIQLNKRNEMLEQRITNYELRITKRVEEKRE